MKYITLIITIAFTMSCNNKEAAPGVTDASQPGSGAENLSPIKDSAERAAEFQDTSTIATNAKIKKSEKDIVVEIVTSSPRYLELTNGLEERVKKNGGTSFGITLEGSPNPNKDEGITISENYDFNVHETYPDRNVNIARFSFSKKAKQLYEYDIVNDTLKAIAFNKDLLKALQ